MQPKGWVDSAERSGQVATTKKVHAITPLTSNKVAILCLLVKNVPEKNGGATLCLTTFTPSCGATPVAATKMIAVVVIMLSRSRVDLF